MTDLDAPAGIDAEKDAAFAAEALPWIDDVYRFALSLTRNEADADDVVQEAFLRAYRSWHTFQPGSDGRRWLFTIARNVFLRSREREKYRVDAEDGDVESLAAAQQTAEVRRSGDDVLLSKIDLQPALKEALGRLDEPFRSTVILVDVEDLPYEAAAEILGVPIGTVRSRLFRARAHLAQRLAPYASAAKEASR